LDAEYQKTEIAAIVGACGMMNTPPGAWETALYNRVPDCGLSEMERLLYEERSLLQAWSLRGAPAVFPVSESDVFLSALVSDEGEPWIYSIPGIFGALDFLQMAFDELFDKMKQVMPQLDDEVIVSKSTLDQTIAGWMLPLLPIEKRELWNHPSMYGNPDKQTVGGAVVSFMLRPCSFNGMVVFGARNGISPTFTSYKNWTGHPLETSGDALKKLARKYLHCYGPTTVDAFARWLGCSAEQGRRIWSTISDEMEQVMVSGKRSFILTADKEQLLSPAAFQRELLLLGGHDPFLDQSDRTVLQPDRSLHKLIWRTAANPGVILHCGKIVGIWTNKKKDKGMEIKMALWDKCCESRELNHLAERYAAFRRQKVTSIEI